MVLSLCAVTARMKDGEFLSNVSAFPDLWSAYKGKAYTELLLQIKVCVFKTSSFLFGFIVFR